MFKWQTNYLTSIETGELATRFAKNLYMQVFEIDWISAGGSAMESKMANLIG